MSLRAALVIAVTAVACGCALAQGASGGEREGAAAALRSAPEVRQLVSFRSGAVKRGTASSAATRVRVGRRNCVAGARTPLAALIRLRPGKLGIRDYGSCSNRGADAGGLYVRSIRGEAARASNGWVYKVGNRLATAGSGDPAGPFGRGRLRFGQQVTWFYCVMRDGSCQRTLALRATPADSGTVAVRVTGHDDAGRGRPAAGATVKGGGVSAVTDDAGAAELSLPSGSVVLRASMPGAVPSFTERVEVP